MKNITMFLIYPQWNINLGNVWSLADSEQFLIYPYWNVNADFKRQAYAWIRVSNLSILECKFVRQERRRAGVGVSNLSILECKSVYTDRMPREMYRFLIYPYWNVNPRIRLSKNLCIAVSNLSILECKLEVGCGKCHACMVSNLSILECKCSKAFQTQRNKARF